jgi:hypothetical protein
MKKKFLLFVGVFFLILEFSNSAWAIRKRQHVVDDDEDFSVSLGYTHLLPSAFVIPSGNFVLGTSAGFGIFDIADLTTNLVYDLDGIFNISTKFAIYHTANFAFAPYVTYTTQTVQGYDMNGNGTTQTSTSLQPGATFSYRILPRLTGHVGGSVVVRNPTIPKGSTNPARTAFVQGTTMNKEFTYGFTQNFALSTGASYDFVYDIWGAGMSFHFGGFQLGGHYYFNRAHYFPY